MNKTALIFILSLLLLSACKKDNPGGGINTTNYYRLSELTAADENMLDVKIVFTYEDNKVKEALKYDYTMKEQWRLANKNVLTYPEANKAINTHYVFIPNDSSWNEEFKHEISLENGNITEDILYFWNNVWEPFDKWMHTYSNDLITQSFRYERNNWEWTSRDRHDYIYEGDLLKQVAMYIPETEGWALVKDMHYEYEYTQLKWIYTMMGVSGIWDTAFKTRLYYKNNRVYISDDYSMTQSGWTLSSTNDYEYDDHGNIIKWQNVDLNPVSYFRLDFKYEAGKGNFDQVFRTDYNEPWNFWMPWPTKQFNNP